MPTTISSTFDIVWSPSNGGEYLNNSSTTLIGSGRSFRVVGVYVTGLLGSVLELRKNNGAGLLVSTVTLASGVGIDFDFPSTMSGLDVSVFSGVLNGDPTTDNLFLIETAGVDTRRVVITCEAASPQVLVAT